MANLPESCLWPCRSFGRSPQPLDDACVATPGNAPPTLTSNPGPVGSNRRRRPSGFEAQPAETPYADLERQLDHMGPALIAIGPAFLALLPGSVLLTPEFKKVRVDPAVIRSALCATMEAPVQREIQEMLDRAQIPPAKQARARDAILRERLGSKRIRGIWLLRLPPGANFWQQLRHAHVPRRLLALARRSCHPIHALDSGLVHCRLKCFTRRDGSRLADSLGAFAADTGAATRAHYPIAGMGRHRRRRALEAAALLRLVAPGARQHPPSRRGPVARARARIRGSGGAGLKRRLARVGRDHRDRCLRSSCCRPAPAAFCNRRCSWSGCSSRPPSRGSIFKAIASGPTFAWR